MTRRLTLGEFQSVIAKLEPKTEKAAIRGFRRAGAFLLRTVVIEIGQTSPHPAVDTGELRNSADLTLIPGGCVVSVDAPHASVIEHGRRPGGRMPPVQPIADWLRRKGFGAGLINKQRKAIAQSAIRTVGRSMAIRAMRSNPAELEEAAALAAAFVIARAIAAKGIAPRHYFKKAWDRSIDRMGFLVMHEIASVGWHPTAATKAKLQAALRGGPS